jgi:hypothetical protein
MTGELGGAPGMPLASGTKNAFHPLLFSTFASRDACTERCLVVVLELAFLAILGRLVTCPLGWALEDDAG